MEVSENKVVSIHYKGTLKEDGSVFDSSEGREPLLFLFGKGMIIPGLEEGMAGLKVGDKKKVEVGFEKAYGPKMEEAKQEVPKDQMPQGADLKVGMQLMAEGPQGAMPVTIASINDTTITVDFNHPLAGKDLIFDIEVVEVREPTKEELEHGHAHGAGGVTHETEGDSEAVKGDEPKKEDSSLEDSLDEKKDEKSE